MLMLTPCFFAMSCTPSSFDYKLFIHCLGQLIAHDFPGIPVYNSYKIHPAALHGAVCDVYSPDVIGVSWGNISK